MAITLRGRRTVGFLQSNGFLAVHLLSAASSLWFLQESIKEFTLENAEGSIYVFLSYYLSHGANPEGNQSCRDHSWCFIWWHWHGSQFLGCIASMSCSPLPSIRWEIRSAPSHSLQCCSSIASFVSLFIPRSLILFESILWTCPWLVNGVRRLTSWKWWYQPSKEVRSDIAIVWMMTRRRIRIAALFQCHILMMRDRWDIFHCV